MRFQTCTLGSRSPLAALSFTHNFDVIHYQVTSRNFAPFPILTTERLILTQLSLDDQENIFALRSYQEVNKYLDRQASTTIQDAINFIININDHIKNNNSIYWDIRLAKRRTFVGTICLFDFSNENNSCEMGYELLPEFQGQGIMKEAAEKVIDYAFQTLHVEKILACTHNRNQHSSTLLTKLHFVQSENAYNTSPDYNIYILTRSRWQ